jgi:hypothetical protein
LGGGALVVQVGVVRLDALPVGLGGRAGVGAEPREFGHEPGGRGVDAVEFAAQVGFLAGAGGGVLGGGGGDEACEKGGAVAAEDPLVQERGDCRMAATMASSRMETE